MPSRRLGIEGLATFKRDMQFDAENCTINIPASAQNAKVVTLPVFDHVMVGIGVKKDNNTQRGRVMMSLLRPRTKIFGPRHVAGFCCCHLQSPKA